MLVARAGQGSFGFELARSAASHVCGRNGRWLMQSADQVPIRVSRSAGLVPRRDAEKVRQPPEVRHSHVVAPVVGRVVPPIGRQRLQRGDDTGSFGRAWCRRLDARLSGLYRRNHAVQ